MSQGRSKQCGRAYCERDGEDVVMEPLFGRLEPWLEPMTIPTLWLDQYNPRGLNEQNAQVAIAAFRYRCPGWCGSPVEICLEPISKSPEEDKEAGELNKAQEVWAWYSQRTRIRRCHLDPGEEALNDPAAHIAG